MDKAYLVIDEKFAEQLGLERFEVVMPSIGFEPKSKLPFKKHGIFFKYGQTNGT
tara:strand:+ start:350 stop:511 length:162 start_codon:yes stop_codon:yes gene_type:complete